MRSTVLAALLSLAWTTASASRSAVFLLDPSSSPQQSTSPRSTLSTIAARCVLAQRAGVLPYHSGDLTGFYGDEAIAAINDYGVHTPLAGSYPSPSTRRATVLLEGIDGVESVASLLSTHRSFLIEPVPSIAATRGLLLDLFAQSDSPLRNTNSDEETLRALAATPKTNGAGDYFYIAQTIEEFEKVLGLLTKDKLHATVMVLPADAGSEKAQWGTYEMPKTESTSEKHQAVLAEKRSSEVFLNTRDNTEYNGTLRGILPACFSSKSACESATLNCTGHGKCQQKYSGTKGGSESPRPCFSCECGTSTSENAQGQTKTVFWGGPACQKRDISSPFWLITLFTIGMIFLIGFAVGQIWTMGDEQLPSVIGAGVSGPVRRS